MCMGHTQAEITERILRRQRESNTREAQKTWRLQRGKLQFLSSRTGYWVDTGAEYSPNTELLDALCDYYGS